MRYYYIHGFNSGSNSSSIERLRLALEEEVVALSYDSGISFEENIKSLIEQIDAASEEDSCIIGTSLGGFYADKVASHFGFPCVLFNPVCKPCEELRQFLGENVNFSTHERYSLTEEILSSYEGRDFVDDCGIQRTVFVSTRDEILLNNDTKVSSLYGGLAEIIVIDCPHRIEDFSPFVNIIKETAHTICL